VAVDGLTAVVTGASGAIGGATAARLAGSGAHVLLCGRDADRLEATAETCRRGAAEGARIAVWAGDLTAPEAPTDLARRLHDELGPADVLVHSAGLFHLAPVAETPVADLERVLAVNLTAPWALTRRLLPDLVGRRGQVVFVNSSAGLKGRGGVAAYAAAKAGLKALADALRDEVNPHGVRVISAFPGRTASDMQRRVRELEGLPYHPERLLQPEDVAEALVHALSLPASAELTDLHLRPMRA
jgi:NAD(P)-dependent dehydrogenase (short-subunit alcohol dehydrogenase family)